MITKQLIIWSVLNQARIYTVLPDGSIIIETNSPHGMPSILSPADLGYSGLLEKINNKGSDYKWS